MTTTTVAIITITTTIIITMAARRPQRLSTTTTTTITTEVAHISTILFSTDPQHRLQRNFNTFGPQAIAIEVEHHPYPSALSRHHPLSKLTIE